MAGRVARSMLASTLLLLGMGPIAAVAATPYLALTLVVSPNPAAPGTSVTFTGTVTPVDGTFSEVTVEMHTGSVPTSCAPAVCSINSLYKTASWTFATVNSKLTVTAEAPAVDGTVSFTVAGCVPNDCLVQNATAVIQAPTVTINLAYSPSGVILPGDVLHFTVSGSTNAGPVDADLQAKLSAGLADPTSLSAGVWNPAPARYIDFNTTLNLTSSYSFDSQVVAPTGGNVSITLTVYAQYALNGTLTKTITLHVGPVATPSPQPTARQTAQPAPIASATPSHSSSPSSVPSATLSAPELSTPSAGGVSLSPDASGGTAQPSPSPSAELSAGGPMSLEAVLVAAGGGGAAVAAWAGVLFLRRRRRGA